MKQNADVIVIGGGHAGIEAALASARKGIPTLLITLRADRIGEMSCNPSIGGVGKGQLVKEIDALGGQMGRTADETGIQFKRLNTRKGSAVQSSRCQSDKKQYALRMQQIVAAQSGLSVLEAEVKGLLVEGKRIIGVQVATPDGKRESISAKSVVITAGTFMRGLMHCGDDRASGGRFGEASSEGLSDYLAALGFTVLRLKTGTPPRLLRDTIDFSRMERQDGDVVPKKFSFFESAITLPQVSCFLTYTNPGTHEIIAASLDRSPLYSGQIKGIGPRYCPSIEDKVVKFREKERHQLFFEPEALDSDWIYPNGISTSLPPDVQRQFVRTLPGCEKVEFARYGYAVEYDCVDPRDLQPSFESKLVAGLYLAGQVNGTSGYEEAAAQGLIAGLNAALSAEGQPPLLLSRSDSYLGVMIDDLVTHGVSEPYRMFTSRAEFRLSLREDNADLRLSEKGYRAGLLSRADYERVLVRKEAITQWKGWLGQQVIRPSPSISQKLEDAGSSPLAQPQSLIQLLKRPELSLADLLTLQSKEGPAILDAATVETLEVEVKYEGYIAIQRDEIERLGRMGEFSIPELLDYAHVTGLSTEVRHNLNLNRPKTLGEAARVSGVTPAAMTALLFHLRQKYHVPAESR